MIVFVCIICWMLRKKLYLLSETNPEDPSTKTESLYSLL